MKCLSIQQPWAHCILRHGKDVENRTWPTRHRGLVVIHAGKKVDRAAYDYIEELFGIEVAPGLWTGALLGTVEITQCRFRSLVEDPLSSRWHDTGQWGFYLQNPRAFRRPIMMAGKLGIFDLTPAYERQVRLEMAEASA